MTTLISASTRARAPTMKSLALAALAAFVAAGCSSGPGLLSGGDSAAPSIALSPSAEQSSAQSAKIQIAPIIGSPENIARDLASQLTTSIERRNITVAKAANATGEYILRGYIVASRDKAGAKVSYIWDVTDQGGRRAHRITGEEIAVGSPGKDPWSSVTPQIVQTIADKTATQIATWIPNGASVPVAGGPAVAGASQVAAANGPLTAPAAPLTTAAVPSAPTTGSIQASGPVSTVVPPITGAPGDGSASLSAAIQRELTRKGVSLTSAAGSNTYKVEGKVAMGQAKDGKQPIQIDWNVIDPAGKKLGTVSQKNEVPQGSLDGAWGKTADAAASAAAQGILKLLPQKTAAN